MTTKNKKISSLFLMLGIIVLGAFLWLSNQPVKIIAVHQKDNFSFILVKNFPYSDKDKIDWWLNNKDMIKTKYNIPRPDSSGIFSISFWDFDEGYKEEGKYDRLCFDDMETKINCIEKNALITITKSSDNKIFFTAENGMYLQKNNGKIIMIKN